MANVKISELPAATVPLAGSELVPIVQSGTTDQVTVANLTAGRTVSAAAVTATGTVSGATVTASGTVSGATVTATGTVSGATVSGTTVSGTTVVAGAGTAAAPSISPTGDSNTGLFFPAADTIAFAEGGVEALRLDASGNVGIGTSTIGQRLVVAGNTTSDAYLLRQNGSVPSSDAAMYRPADNTLGFVTASTERARITSTGDFQFNSGYGSVATAYACRAWVNFNGTGTVAIRASGNVSSITDNGTGDYTVNFTAAVPDANYAVSGLAQLNGSSTNGNGNTIITLNRIPANALTTSSVRIMSQAIDGSGTFADSLNVCVSIFR